MKPYSEDLRECVVRSVLIGTPRDDVAARFAVSLPTIERWLRLKRETGAVAPKPVPGPVAVKTNALLAALPERLSTHADATLSEQCAWWVEQAGVEVSTATMSRALTRLGWTRKNSSWATAHPGG
jgi:transposase